MFSEVENINNVKVKIDYEIIFNNIVYVYVYVKVNNMNIIIFTNNVEVEFENSLYAND